jgi:hypothetical protein
MRAVIYCMMTVGLIGGCAKPQSALPTAAVSDTLNVLGETADRAETFSGTITGNVDGAGTFWLESDKGLSCIGLFVDVAQKIGNGSFNCSNDQSGSFDFISTGRRGSGTARIGQRQVTFRFG